jgi:ABC-2 type transport system permease protein
MAVYKRGYERYSGERTGALARLLVLPRFAWAGLMEQRLLVIIFVVSLFWPIACGAFVYVANRGDLLASFGPQVVRFLQIDGQFFAVFMNTQALFAVILAAFAGPSLIAPDLANGALPLYFSRPLTRWEYVLARMLVLLGVLSPVTWIPGLLLFLMQSGMAGWTWFANNWTLGAAIVLGFFMWIVFVSLVAMASSAYVKWRVIAGALVIGFFFVATGATEIMRQILRVDWPRALNPAQAMNQIWNSMLGVNPISAPSATACLLTMLAISALLVLVLERRLRPVEVVK